MQTKSRRWLAGLINWLGAHTQRHKEEQKGQRDRSLKAARFHAIRLGALVLRGEPKVDEPLEAAWARCLTKFDVHSRVESAMSVDKEFGDASLLADAVLKELPGETKQQKFQHIFDIAPHWLLRFTRAAITACELGIQFPDLSDSPKPCHLGAWEGRIFRMACCSPGFLYQHHGIQTRARKCLRSCISLTTNGRARRGVGGGTSSAGYLSRPFANY
jgi:hypothetical protein